MNATALFSPEGRTSAALLLRVHAFFRQHPSGRIKTGVWTDPEWGRAEFLVWFRECLDQKINRDDRRPWRCLTREWQADMAHDARLINAAVRGIRQSGCNLLLTPEMQRRYPHVNTHRHDD